MVDGRYRTIATRGGRAVIGTSAGGYGAAVIGLHHLGTYSVVESWSGYSLRAAFARQPTFLGFYVGSGDTTFLEENVELARELSRAKVPFLFEIYPGGHARSLWEGQAPRWLGLAVDHLARAT